MVVAGQQGGRALRAQCVGQHVRSQQVHGRALLLAGTATGEGVVRRGGSTECRMDECGHDRERSAAGLAQVIGLRAQRTGLAQVGVQATPHEPGQRDMTQAVMRGDGGNEGGQVDGRRWHGTSIWTRAVLARASGWTSTLKRREGQAETWTSRTRVMPGRRRKCGWRARMPALATACGNGAATAPQSPEPAPSPGIRRGSQRRRGAIDAQRLRHNVLA